MPYEWDFASVWRAWPVLFEGLANTVRLFLLAAFGGLLIGLVAGIARTLKGPLAWGAAFYVQLFRNTPVIVQLFILFYAVPIATGLQSNAFLAAWLTLSLYSGAYIAEIYRGGIQSIERGQWEAAKALGMGFAGQMRYIVLPQAVKRMVPAFTNRLIELFKLTAIAYLVAYHELVYQTRLIADMEFRPIEAFTVLALFFAGTVLPMSYLSNRLERRLARSD